MIDSVTLASQTKLAAASRPSVLAAAVDSVTLAPETPSQAPESDNVRKCPVLSGPTGTPPVSTINLLCQQYLQQFTSCIRPDMLDILQHSTAGVEQTRVVSRLVSLLV